MDSHRGSFMARYGDVALALCVIGMVGMMIVPLPTFLLDLLISLNITAAVLLLLVSLYVPNVLRISAFPAILLLTTLFRLALNVSSTRLILLQADAGEVIDAFGNFVVQGNYVVGAVIFLILTIIQFLVVAKGAERVSEVAARFTLDAMPGKQMAIDADLRAGAFDLDEAQRRRAMVQRESKLYGAMDGAMKFVKGDAIAGVIITTINVVAGMIIGVLQLEMSAAEAARTYSILTIGDGLVSQLPALLIATTAGIIVTRVASDADDADLGSDIATQIMEHPRAIAITAGLLVGLAVVPGLPTVPFLVMGSAVGFVAWRLRVATRRSVASALGGSGELIGEVGEHAASAPERRRLVPMVTPVVVEVGGELTDEFGTERLDWLEVAIGTMRAEIFGELGVKIPPVRLRRRADCGAREFVVMIEEVPVERDELPPGVVLSTASTAQVAELGFECARTRHPATRANATWVPARHAAALEEAGFRTSDGAEVLLLRVTTTIRAHAADFVDLDSTRELLDQLEERYPATVDEVVGKLVGVQALSEVLGRLVAEKISIRNLRRILQVIAERGADGADPEELTEVVREGLSRYITHRYSDLDGTLAAYLIDREIEEMIAGAVRRSERGSYLAFPPELTREIVEAVTSRVREDVEMGRLPILLTDQRVRRHVKRLVDADVPEAVVLAFQELDPSVEVRPAGRVVVGRGDRRAPVEGSLSGDGG